LLYDNKLTIGIVALTSYFVYQYFHPRRFNSLQGFTRYPIVGNVEIYKYAAAWDFPTLLHIGFQKFGEIYRVTDFARTRVVISNAKAAKQVLTHSDFVKNETLQFISQGIMDNALFVMPSLDEDWKKHRKLLQPAFGAYHQKQVAVVTDEKTRKLIDILKSRIQNGDTGKLGVNAQSLMAILTLDILGIIAFGHDLKRVDMIEQGQEHQWEDLTSSTIDCIPYRFASPKFMWNYLGVGSESPNIKAAKNRIDKFLDDLVTEHMKVIEKESLSPEFQKVADKLEKKLQFGFDA